MRKYYKRKFDSIIIPTINSIMTNEIFYNTIVDSFHNDE